MGVTSRYGDNKKSRFRCIKKLSKGKKTGDCTQDGLHNNAYTKPLKVVVVDEQKALHLTPDFLGSDYEYKHSIIGFKITIFTTHTCESLKTIYNQL